MQGLAVLLWLAAAACWYLAAPNQVLCAAANGVSRPPLPPAALFWSGAALTAAGTWLMAVAEGWPVAIAAMLVTLTCSLSLWPFVGSYVHHRRGGFASRRRA